MLPRLRRLLALTLTLGLMAGALTVAAAPSEASAASTSVSASAVLKSINKKRAAHGLEPFLVSAELNAWAQADMKRWPLGLGGDANTYPLPVDAITGEAPEFDQYSTYVTWFGKGRSLQNTIIDFLTNWDIPTRWNVRGYSHAGFGSYTVGRKTYYELVVANYPECAPQKLTAGKPTISGSGVAGGILVANPGRWSSASNLRYRYEWRIGGRIVGTTRYYQPARAEIGKKVTVTVEGSKDCFTTPAAVTSSPKTVKNTTRPVVSGDRNVGSTLTVDPGTWFTAGSALSYQWYLNGSDISWATDPTWLVPDYLTSGRVTVRVTAKKPGYSASRMTVAVAPLGLQLLPATPDPVISGSAIVGETLTADASAWGLEASELDYVWRLDGATVRRASGPTFVVPQDAVGKRVTVAVTGSRENFATATRTSSATDVVAGATFPALVTNVTVRGELAVGSKLSVYARNDLAAFDLRWYVDGRALSTSVSYTLDVTNAMRGKHVELRYSVHAPGYQRHTGSIDAGIVS